jgi:hypothetical protein
LTFNGLLISGAGEDANGRFEISGEFFPDYRRVLLDKTSGGVTAHYDGRWDGLQIAGTWSVRVIRVSEAGVEHLEQKGTFELWPEGSEHSLIQTSEEHFPHNPSE